MHAALTCGVSCPPPTPEVMFFSCFMFCVCAYVTHSCLVTVSGVVTPYQCLPSRLCDYLLIPNALHLRQIVSPPPVYTSLIPHFPHQIFVFLSVTHSSIPSDLLMLFL